MQPVYRDIFRAIHEGKWLNIEYQNKNGERTKYWIAVCSLDPVLETLDVFSLHLRKHSVIRLEKIFLRSVLTAQIVEGTWCSRNEDLIRDISENPYRYQKIFGNTANLKVLNYYEQCSLMDFTPYCRQFDLVKYIDDDIVKGKKQIDLSDEQFGKIVQYFQIRLLNEKKQNEKLSGKKRFQQLVLNELSIMTDKGLYLLAYRKLHFDIKERCLRPDELITVCREFTLDGGQKITARRFLDAEDYELLDDFEKNRETIKDRIMRFSGANLKVDDLPYVVGIEGDVALDLHQEYEGLQKQMESEQPPVPLRAFFGDLLERPAQSRKVYPLALPDRKVNLDQLLAINNAMKYPVAYVQGPPGTGKTSTIVGTILTAFFNERTVLFSSYNNTPIDGVVDKLRALKYENRPISFPILRLGNQEKVREAALWIRSEYQKMKDIKVFADTLNRRKDGRTERARAFSRLMQKYDSILDLRERRETLMRVIEEQNKAGVPLSMLAFDTDLKNRQIQEIEKEIRRLGEVTEEEALSLLDQNDHELRQFLYYTSARYWQKLSGGEYADFLSIVQTEDEGKLVEAFNRYLSDSEHIRLLQQVFPVIATTCIGAHRLGEPETLFDLVIMDEASQCNTAVSLVPVLRGENLMLVGDPQQLNPVILLDELVNEELKKRYRVADEYDYRKNSVYKTFLACDSVSDEVLLHNHYRCNKKIIDFNNKKYYNGQLKICTESTGTRPLTFTNFPHAKPEEKNTSIAEAEAIVSYAEQNRDQSVGIITPFVNQRMLIEKLLAEKGIYDIPVGTVHAFQGDEKDVILFSTAITEATWQGTYDWLKNNKELLNVATSRAREQLIVLSDSESLEKLHAASEGSEKSAGDDLYELVEYVRKNGETVISSRENDSRALGVKPFSTETEEAFLTSLITALQNIWMTQNRYSIHKEVAISQVFSDNLTQSDLFYRGRFDFVIYRRQESMEIPMLAIELDGKEHFEDALVQKRDRKKQEICEAHHLQLIRVENSYARRYMHIKRILEDYFRKAH